jgi:hypothetical protein
MMFGIPIKNSTGRQLDRDEVDANAGTDFAEAHPLSADVRDHLDAAGITYADEVGDDRPRFTPGYPVSDARIYRSRLHVNSSNGVATVTFRGVVIDATRAWIERGSTGRLSLYCEVIPTDDTATEVRVAVVPTGKRVPDVIDGGPTLRLGSVGGQHVYLLSVDGTIDRAAYDEARAARAAERAARRVQRTDLVDVDGDTDEWKYDL